MTLKFQSEEILQSLTMVSSVVNSKNSLPVLNDVRIETKDDGNGGVCVELMASDSETWLQMKTSCIEGEIGLLICIEAKSFLNALRNLGGKPVEMTVDEDKHIITCKYDNGKFQLPYDDAVDFPMPTSVGDEAVKKMVDNTKLQVCLEKAGFATANDELRPVMNGVHFDFMPYGLVSVASDGHKLAKYTDKTILLPDNDIATGFTLPKKPCHILMNVLSSTLAGDVKVVYNGNSVSVNNKMFKLTARLIEGKFPNYDSVIPKDNDKVICLNKVALIAALKRVLPMGDTSSQLLELRFTPQTLSVFAQDIEFSRSAREDVSCDYMGEDFAIGFKGSTLLQMVQNIDGEVVRLLLKEPSKAGIVTEEKENSVYDYTSIIMPMLIQ